jgi:hypothetical protein
MRFVSSASRREDKRGKEETEGNCAAVEGEGKGACEGRKDALLLEEE